MGKKLESFIEILDPNFINSSLIGDVGSEKVVTIKGFEEAEYFNSKANKNVHGAAVYFEECLPLILNATNTKTLKRLFSPNSDDTSKCIGHKVTLFVTTTHKPGGGRDEVVNCIRIKEFSEEKCPVCGKVILPYAGKSVQEIMEISKRNLGSVMCGECMKNKAKETKDDK